MGSALLRPDVDLSSLPRSQRASLSTLSTSMRSQEQRGQESLVPGETTDHPTANITTTTHTTTTGQTTMSLCTSPGIQESIQESIQEGMQNRQALEREKVDSINDHPTTRGNSNTTAEDFNNDGSPPEYSPMTTLDDDDKRNTHNTQSQSQQLQLQQQLHQLEREFTQVTTKCQEQARLLTQQETKLIELQEQNQTLEQEQEKGHFRHVATTRTEEKTKTNHSSSSKGGRYRITRMVARVVPGLHGSHVGEVSTWLCVLWLVARMYTLARARWPKNALFLRVGRMNLWDAFLKLWK